MYYRKHLFICTNQKTNGKPCCATGGADEMFQHLKEQIKAKGLAGPGGIRVSKSGCLGRCSEGPNIVVYPEGSWYHNCDREMLDRIILDLLDVC